MFSDVELSAINTMVRTMCTTAREIGIPPRVDTSRLFRLFMKEALRERSLVGTEDILFSTSVTSPRLLVSGANFPARFVAVHLHQRCRVRGGDGHPAETLFEPGLLGSLRDVYTDGLSDSVKTAMLVCIVSSIYKHVPVLPRAIDHYNNPEPTLSNHTRIVHVYTPRSVDLDAVYRLGDNLFHGIDTIDPIYPVITVESAAAIGDELSRIRYAPPTPVLPVPAEYRGPISHECLESIQTRVIERGLPSASDWTTTSINTTWIRAIVVDAVTFYGALADTTIVFGTAATGPRLLSREELPYRELALHLAHMCSNKAAYLERYGITNEWTAVIEYIVRAIYTSHPVTVATNASTGLREVLQPATYTASKIHTVYIDETHFMSPGGWFMHNDDLGDTQTYTTGS